MRLRTIQIASVQSQYLSAPRCRISFGEPFELWVEWYRWDCAPAHMHSG